MHSGPEPDSVLLHLANWIATLSHEAIPPSVLQAARDCLVDTLGVALAGSRTHVAEVARSAAERIYATGHATALGSASRMSAPGAAFVNACAAHALDFDDNCYAGFVHGSAVLVPASLAAAEARDISGKAFLTALIAGAEVEYAVGKAATPSLYAKGWWTTGVLGPVGAAAAAASAFGLERQQVAAALGTAVAGTGGAKSCFGTDAKPLLCGRAAEGGVTACILASSGASGPSSALEDTRGFWRLFNDGIWEPQPLRELGLRWSLLDPGIDVKRIPVCLSAHAAVDALMALMAEYDLAVDDVERIECDVSGIVVANLVHDEPRTPQEAQFSLPFAIGCSLVNGDVRLEQLRPEVLRSPTLQAVMRRVSMVSSDRWEPGTDLLRRHPEGAFVTLMTADGRRFEKFGDYARGMKQRPLSQAELDGKFLDCAGAVEGLDSAALLARLRGIDELDSIRDVLADAAPQR
jgi:2-methylcitrate dehydratase PrpD